MPGVFDNAFPAAAGSEVYPPDTDVLASSPSYGPSGSDFTGRWHEESLTEDNVRIAITYGVDSGQTGTLDPGGAVNPSPPGWSTLYGVVYDELGQPEEGVTIRAKIIRAPQGDNAANNIFDTQIREQVSDASGVVQFANFPIGGTAQVQRGSTWHSVDVAEDTEGGGVTAISDFIGSEAATGLVGGLW